MTADNGMRAKSQALDLRRVLSERSIQAEAIPIIKDHYVAHHQNLGGVVYVYLNNRCELAETISVLAEEPGVEGVLESCESAARFHLHPGRIGDLMVLATADTVFGSLEAREVEVDLRSHGSLHGREGPFVAYGGRLLED